MSSRHGRTLVTCDECGRGVPPNEVVIEYDQSGDPVGVFCVDCWNSLTEGEEYEDDEVCIDV
jgi:hypothetical protein